MRNLKKTNLSLPKVTKMGKLFIAVFLIVIFEGALRKWVSNSLTNPIILLRDSLAVYGIYWAISHGKLTKIPQVSQLLIFWTVCLVLWGALQLIVNDGSILLYIIGLRFWLLYLWFGVVAGISLTAYDFNYVIKVLLKTALVILPLVVLQFFSPPDSFINKQLDDDATGVFRLSGDIVRTTGTFSFTAGETIYLSILGPLVFGTITSANKLFISKLLPMIIIMAYFTLVLLAGSRTALLTFVIQFICFIVIEFLYLNKSDKPRNKNSKFLLIGALLSLCVLPFILTTAIDATTERLSSASDAEDPIDRILTNIFGEVTLDSFNFFGFGLGAGSNFAGIVNDTNFSLGEFEASRILNEAGIVGVLFIGLKIATLLIGLKQATKASKLTNSPLPLLLWITLGIALFSWQLHGQLTINAFGYLLLGLGIASTRKNNIKKA